MNKESVFVQAEREKLQGAVSKLSQEKGLVELRLRSYEAEKTRLAPTLEETQWEVSRLHDHAVDSRLPATSGSWGLLTSLRGAEDTQGSPLMFVDPGITLRASAQTFTEETYHNIIIYRIIMTASFRTLDSRTAVS